VSLSERLTNFVFLSAGRPRTAWLSGCAMAVALLVAACGGSSSPSPGSDAKAPGSGTPATAVPSTDAPPLSDEQAKTAEAFYTGRTVRIIVGSGAGGGFDTTARVVARHLPKHIPGKPTVIVENVPGGGGLVAANHVFSAAPKDGLVLGLFHEAQVMNQLTRAPGVQFDLRQFNWLGSSYHDPNVCIIRRDAPVAKFEDLIGGATPILIGATGPGSNAYDVPKIVAAATGATLKVVPGYGTTNDVRLGMERGEVHGACFGWESVQATAGQWLQSGEARVLVQNGATRHPDLPDVPSALEFANDEESRRMLLLLDAPGAISKPFALPPGVDPLRVQVMRRALMATFEDAAFLSEARTMHLHFAPNTPAEIQRILDDVLGAPPSVAARYRKVIES
jgi:tripartite-type tricarboxylate transporter receptor subunit TctC